MRELALKHWLAGTLILSHLSLVALCIVLYLLRGLLFEEMSTCVAILGPMFAVYATAALRSPLRGTRARRGAGRRVSRGRAFVVLVFPLTLTVLSVSLLLATAMNVGFSTFEQFKTTLGLVQGAVGVYVGLVITSFTEAETSGATTAIETSGALGDRSLSLNAL